MNADIAERSTKKRESAVVIHNRKTGVRPVHFSDGDFVLLGLLQSKTGLKPDLRWKGPYRVAGCRSNYIFEIEDLLSGKTYLAPVHRLKFFRNKDFEVTEEVTNHIAHQEDEFGVIYDLDVIKSSSDVSSTTKNDSSSWS